MLMLPKFMLDVTLNLQSCQKSPELCYHVRFPRGPLSVTDLSSFLFDFLHPQPVQLKRNHLNILAEPAALHFAVSLMVVPLETQRCNSSGTILDSGLYPVYCNSSIYEPLSCYSHVFSEIWCGCPLQRLLLAIYNSERCSCQFTRTDMPLWPEENCVLLL